MSRVPVVLVGLAALLALCSAGPRVQPPVSRTLPNGLRVVVFPRPGLPIVQMQLQVPAGLRAEPEGQAGVAHLTSQLVRLGTTSRSADDLATELDSLGATFVTTVNRDVAQVAVGSRVAEFESALELMSDAVVNPLVSEEAFRLARRQAAAQLGLQAQSPAAITDERAVAEAFGPHPYSHPVRGTLATLLALHRDQVRAFHRDYWRPDAAVLAIAGDVDPNRAFAAAAEWFNRWSPGRVSAPAPAAPKPKRGNLLLDLPGSPVTEIRLWALAPGRGAPGYASWTLATTALEAEGLPPGARVTLMPARDVSLLMVSASARPESAGVVASRARAALTGFAKSPPEGGALDPVRRRALGVWLLSLETQGQLLSSWLAGDAAGLPVDHLSAMPESLARATPRTAAQALASGVTMLIAGPAQRMRGALASLGRLDTLTTEGLAAERQADVQVSPEQRRRGRQLVEAALTAHGGAKIKGVKSTLLDGEVRMRPSGREMVGEMRFLRVEPSRLAYTSRFLEFELRQIMDGDRGWALSLAGDSAALLPADSTTLTALRGIFASDLVHLLQDATGPGGDPVSHGASEQDGRKVQVVEFNSRAMGRTRLSLDESNRVVSVEMTPTPQGTWRDRRRWSEFAPSQGILWPRQETRDIDGEEVSRFILRRAVVNGEVDTTLFQRPIVKQGKILGVE